MADNTTLGGLWGTIKEAFSEYGRAKKEETIAKKEETKAKVETLIKETRAKAEEVKKEVAAGMKGGAKVTLNWIGRGLAAVKAAPSMALETAKAIGRVTANTAKEFKNKAIKTVCGWGLKVKASLMAGLNWMKSKGTKAKEAMNHAYNAAKGEVSSVITATKEGSRKVGNTVAAKMKDGAKKTWNGSVKAAKIINKAVLYTAAAPVVIAGLAVYGTYKAGEKGFELAGKAEKVAIGAAKEFKNKATRTVCGWGLKAKDGLMAGLNWMKSKGTAAKTGLTNQGNEAINRARAFTQNAKHTIAGSQAYRTATMVSGKMLGAVKQGMQQQRQTNALAMVRLQTAGRGGKY